MGHGAPEKPLVVVLWCPCFVFVLSLYCRDWLVNVWCASRISGGAMVTLGYWATAN